MKYGYARISTIDQNADMQLKALQRAGCKKIFKDELSGATTKRPALLRCLKSLKDGDTLIVWKLDRLARSVRDLITIVEDFEKRGIAFGSLTEEINTTTPGGTLIFHIFAALAQFERGLIIERTREGMKAARARGVKSGPPPKLTRQQIDHAKKLIDSGQRREDVADLFKVSRTTLYRALA
ncbi:MAG: recombinase family protein [Pseudomonadota bacterium]|nr:recombinase family protein [Pseudomonadota bacterium]